MSGSSTPVVYDYDTWVLMFPEFSTTVPNTTVGQGFFNRACLLLDNTDCAIVPNCPPTYERAILLDLLTAHIAVLSVGSSLTKNAASPLVGRITNATQGSVSVAASMGPVTTSSAYFMQTSYGAEYWQASAGYRAGGRYAPGSVPNFSDRLGGYGQR